MFLSLSINITKNRYGINMVIIFVLMKLIKNRYSLRSMRCEAGKGRAVRNEKILKNGENNENSQEMQRASGNKRHIRCKKESDFAVSIWT